MPVESASFISQLNPANPTASDLKSEGDDQIRLVKSVLQSQFPNLGATAVTPTAAQLNTVGITQAATDNSTAVASTACVDAKILASSGITAQLPGQGGNAGRFLTTNGTSASWASADPAPIGTIVYAPTAPTSGTWLKCDGSSYLQATYPALFAQLGRRWSVLPTPNVVANTIGASTGITTIGSLIGSANKFYLAGSGSNSLFTSTDGVSWTTAPTVAFAGSGGNISIVGSTIIVRSQGTQNLWFSNDEGVTFTGPITTGFTYVNQDAIVLVNGRYYMNVTGGVATTTSLSTAWTLCTGLSSLNATTYTMDGVASGTNGSNLLNIVSNGTVWAQINSTANTVFTSTDGVAFTPRTCSVAGGVTDQLFAFGTTFFALAPQTAGPVNYLMRSTDGTTWTNVHPNSATSGAALYTIQDAGTYLFALDSLGVYTSTNAGLTWTFRRAPAAGMTSVNPTGSQGRTSAIFAGGAFYWVAGTAGVVSFDGTEFRVEAVTTAVSSGITAALVSGARQPRLMAPNVIVWGSTVTTLVMKVLGYPAFVHPLASSAQIAFTASRMMTSTSSATPAGSVTTAGFLYNTATEFVVPNVSPVASPNTAYIKAA